MVGGVRICDRDDDRELVVKRLWLPNGDVRPASAQFNEQMQRYYIDNPDMQDLWNILTYYDDGRIIAIQRGPAKFDLEITYFRD